MNKKQLNELRRLVHALKPVVIIGANGLTEAVHAEIETAISAHELIKIKVNAEDKAERDQLTDRICAEHNAELIQKIGHVIAIYRERPVQDD